MFEHYYSMIFNANDIIILHFAGILIMSNFYDDLVRIRKEKRLSRQDVFYKCRIPMETIEAIEDGSMLAGKVRNKTYMRGYFRTYAKAIGISDEDITTALDEHDAGLYNQGLLTKYLPAAAETEGEGKGDDEHGTRPAESGKEKEKEKEKVEKEEKKTDKPDRPPDAASSDKTDKTGKSGSKPPGSGKSKIITPESQEKTAEDIDWEDKTLKKIRSTSTAEYSSAEEPAKKAPAPVKLPDSPDVAGVDWASKVKQAVYRPQRNRLLWVILATLLALALALASIVWYWQSNEAEPGTSPAVDRGASVAPSPDPDLQPAPDATDPVAQDAITAEEPEVEEEVVPPVERTPLTREEIISQISAASTTGDTLFVYAYALHGNLEPIRVQSDIFGEGALQNLASRPYWVEHYQAMQFDFLDEIVFQGNLARMVLVINGHVIEDFSNFFIDGSRISISRESLMDNGTFEIAETDPFTTLDPPRSLVERPRFSP